MAKNTNGKGKRKLSYLWSFTDRFTAMLYAILKNGRIGNMLSFGGSLYNNSLFYNTYQRKKSNVANAIKKYPEMIMGESAFSKIMRFFGMFFASLGLNVYGVFLVLFGLTSCVAYLIPAFANGFSSFDEAKVALSILISFCSLPMLFSSKTAVEALSESKIMSKIVLDIFCVPKEHLRSKKKYGGTGYIFSAAVIAILLGISSLYTHPLLVPLELLYFTVVFAVLAYPEIGVIAIFAMLPFMMCFPNPRAVLLISVLFTGISYMIKVFQRKRIFSLTVEIDMILLMCGFMVVCGSFTRGGAETFGESVSTAVIIFGGYVLTYYLFTTEKLMHACIKTLTASFLLLCFIGIWEGGYYGISARIIDSMGPDISSITSNNLLNVSDNGAVFGMLAVLIFPLLFTYITKQKSVQRIIAVAVLGSIAIIAVWMCSSYEIIIALMLESIIFWFLYSHKTMNVVIFALIPFGIIAMLYPGAVKYWGFPNISELFMEYMPASMTDHDVRGSVVRDVIKMISDGNIFGIGTGDGIFAMIFPNYASVSSAGAEDPMSFLLQLICWAGIFGAIAFLIFALFLFKRSLGFLISCDNCELRSRALALFSGISAALLLGQVYSIWSDVRIMYLFWAFAGLMMSLVKIGRMRERTRESQFVSTELATDVEVIFYD